MTHGLAVRVNVTGHSKLNLNKAKTQLESFYVTDDLLGNCDC